MIAAIFPPVTERGLYHDRLTQIRERNGYSGVIDMSSSLYAQECHSVERSVEELHQHVAEVLTSFVEGYEMRKNSYTTQLKRMREVSNNATRNAIQTCKMDATAALNHLKAALDREKEKEFHEIKRQLREAELNNGKFVNELASVRAQLEAEQTQVREQNYKMERITNEFVKSAEAAQSTNLARLTEVQKKCEEQVAKERVALKAEQEDRCRTLAMEHESQMLAQERHFGEIRQMLTDQLQEKDAGIAQLKESVQAITKQLAVEHENYNRNLADEQLKHDNAVKLVHAEHLKATALLKAEIASKIQQLKADEQQREEELDLFVTKEKEKLVSTHVCELELYEHNSKQEMKRLQQHLETKHKEELIKIKYMHELELTRALRENDRLSKLLIRATGSGGGSSSVMSEHDSGDHSDSTRGGSSRFGRSSGELEAPPPPPSTQPPPARPSAGPGTSRVNKWDALNKSLVRDHDYLNSGSNSASVRASSARSSNNGPPPDDFTVNDALAHSNVGRERNQRQVTANMGKVNSYMSKLQRYLEDYQDSPGADANADGDGDPDASDTSLGVGHRCDAPGAFAQTGSREDIERAMADAEGEDDCSTADSLEDPQQVNTTTYFSPDVSRGGPSIAGRVAAKPSGAAFAPRVVSYTTVPATADDSSAHNMTRNLLGSSMNDSQSVSMSSDARNLLGTSSAIDGDSDSDNGSFNLI